MPDDTKFPTRPVKTLLSLVHEQFPELVWRDYQLITEGWDHEVLILDDRLVFRFPNDKYYLGLLKNEIRLLEELRPLVTVNVPDYTYVSPDSSFAGYPLIPGKTLSKPLFDSLSTETRTQIANQLADLLSVMHAMATDGHDLSYIPGWDFAEEQAEVRQLAAKHLPEALSQEDYALVEKILDEVDTLARQPLPKVFIHGDIYSNHLLWDSDTNQLGVIDFSDMSRGDPAYDFGELHEYGPDFVRQAYNHYTGPKDKTFLARTWAYQQWAAINMLTDHFVVGKTPFAIARQTFDRLKL